MAATIIVQKTGNLEFLVGVSEPGGESTHRVTVKQVDYDRLTGGKIEPEELIKQSFKFLLERESKESILAHFDLSVISRYFPEYENEMEHGTRI